MSDQIVFSPKDLIRSREFNLMFSKIFAKLQKLSMWTTVSRPTGTELFQYRTYGFNTDFLSLEIFLGPAEGWIILAGTWSANPDAIINNIAIGSRGFNLTDEQAYIYTGNLWVVSA